MRAVLLCLPGSTTGKRRKYPAHRGGGKKARMKRQEEAGLERAEKSDDKKDRAEAGRFEEQGMGLGVA